MYAEVNGLRMYYEVHGEGRPVVLLHGGLHTIDVSFGELLPGLAEDFRIIAVDLQGHGRTEDIDRPPLLEHLATDVLALLDEVGTPCACSVFCSLASGLSTSRPRATSTSTSPTRCAAC